MKIKSFVKKMIINDIIFILFLSFFINILKTNSQQKDYQKEIKIFSDKAWEAITEKKDSGIYFSNKIIEISIENNDSFNEMLGYEYRGIYNEAVLNNYDNSIQDFLEAIKISEKKHKKYIPDLYLEIGILFQKINHDLKALTYLEKAVELSSNKKVTNCYAILSLAETQSKLKKYQESEVNFIYFLNNCQLTNQEIEEAYLGLANNFSRQQKAIEAHTFFIKSIYADSLKGAKNYGLYYSDLINNAIKMNNNDTIKKYLKFLHKSFKYNFVLNERLKYFESASNSYKFLKDYEKAMEFQDSILIVKDSLALKIYNKNLSELETKYQTKKRIEQIENEKDKRKLWILISIFSFFVLLIVIILFIKNSKKRNLLQQNKIALEKLLKQRNMLLKETHHRVKNSFQMVSSLLQLQAQGSEAEVAVKALETAVQRVNSMIVLHQQLYAKDNLLGIDIKLYIKDLINEIQLSYPTEKIIINSIIDSQIFDIDKATTIGLLVNELYTNSVKHAWQNEPKEKVITLNIIKKETETYFEMFDNGKVKKSKSIKKNYGCELLEILIERLDATIVKNEDHYGVYLNFKNDNENQLFSH